MLPWWTPTAPIRRHPSQRERDRSAERLEAAGWRPRVWSWRCSSTLTASRADPACCDRALRLVQAEEPDLRPAWHHPPPPPAAADPRRAPRPSLQRRLRRGRGVHLPDGCARFEEHLATEVRSFLGFEQRSVLLDVRFQRHPPLPGAPVSAEQAAAEQTAGEDAGERPAAAPGSSTPVTGKLILGGAGGAAGNSHGTAARSSRTGSTRTPRSPGPTITRRPHRRGRAPHWAEG